MRLITLSLLITWGCTGELSTSEGTPDTPPPARDAQATPPSILNDDDAATPIDPCAAVYCGRGACVVEAGAARCACDEGAQLQGAVCVDAAAPCVGFDCGAGSCAEVDGAARCACDEGAVLIEGRCFDPCAEVACGGGDCVAGACVCHAGFSLQSGVCVDPCAGFDCAPGACRPEGGGAICDCPSTYRAEGRRCLDLCARAECGGGHVCDVIDGAPTCVCPEGEQELPDGACGVPSACEGVDCSGNGVCEEVGGAARCECEAGYTPQGLHCVDLDDPCAGQICSGRGECLDRGGVPVCACQPGFTPSTLLGLDCAPTREVCRGGPIDYDFTGDGIAEDWFEPNDEECEMFELINYTRATHDHQGMPECFTPLAYDALWSAHARLHTQNMRMVRRLWHFDSPFAQNCAQNHSVEGVMRAYMTGITEPHCPLSSHHCNIMHCNRGAVGIGYIDGWNVQNFLPAP